MDAKDLIKNKSMCVLPWTGFQLEPAGTVKNCVISKDTLGDINHTDITQIMQGHKNISLKRDMLADKRPMNCAGCYRQEEGRNDLGSISSRLYYLKELASKRDMSTFDAVENFSLEHVDLRWSNACNQACVYCGPELSSKWAQELNVRVKSDKKARQNVKEFVFSNIHKLKNVYLAGGEPMLMKENQEFLSVLKEKNPECSVRVNTNLSTTDTGIFDLLCEFKNVHWTVSAESIESEYEYIRHHGTWANFRDNLKVIGGLNHKLSFNMLHLILNHQSLFDAVDHFKSMGFHDNSFVIGPLMDPTHLHLMNLPGHVVMKVLKTLRERLDAGATGYLKNSYENLLGYYNNTSWNKNLRQFVDQSNLRDRRRNTNWCAVFPKLKDIIDAETLE